MFFEITQTPVATEGIFSPRLLPHHQRSREKDIVSCIVSAEVFICIFLTGLNGVISGVAALGFSLHYH